MGRTVRILVLILLFLGFAAALCGGAIFIISGGKPLDFAQKTLIRVSLSGRDADLNRAVSSDPTPIRFTVEFAPATGQNSATPTPPGREP